jgi:hypothetical protein
MCPWNRQQLKCCNFQGPSRDPADVRRGYDARVYSGMHAHEKKAQVVDLSVFAADGINL